MDKRTMLKLKCADLIAMDRAGTPRDDGYHKFMRKHYEQAQVIFFVNLVVYQRGWWL